MVAWVCATVVLLAGCCPAVRHLYPGPKVPASETARISVDRENLGIDRVDGHRTICFPDMPATDVVVLPGAHTLQVRWSGPGIPFIAGGYAIGYLRFESLVGHHYVLSSWLQSNTVFFTVKEADTGEVVAETQAGKKLDFTTHWPL